MMEEQYFKLVRQAQSVVDRGEVLPCADSIAAYLDGFPMPDPAFGQVWWTAWSGPPIPVFVGQVGFTNRGPQVAVRMEPNSFLVFDKRQPQYHGCQFVYAPTPQEYDLWKHPIESFDPVI